MASRFRWLVAITITITVAATAAATAPAAAASTAASTVAVAAPATASVTSGKMAGPAGWRITAVYPEDSGVDGIAAASADNAWAVENCTRPCHTGSEGFTLRHWNGKRWQVVTAKPAHTVDGVGLLGIAPGARSMPWSLYSYETFTRNAVAHWTGTSWSKPTLLSKNAHIDADVIPSSSAIWLFGSIETTGKPYTVRYNGTTWSAAPSPGISVLSASAASPDDIWVTGSRIGAAKGSWPMAVSHWNGTKWTVSLLPRVPVPARSAAAPLSVVAGGARDAYAFGYLQGPDGSIVPNDGLILYHWNGATWTAVTIPYKETQAFSISSDGHGGIWFWAEVDPGHHDYLIHYRAGHWSEVTDPRPAGAFSVQTYEITPIPGTTSLWASGIASVPIPVGGNPGGTKGLILKYGA